jgi:nitrite reductase/ring-hydroxylating ferredoxin subunit
MEERPAWKDDFPVAWADDHFVTRREFTKSLVLVSCAAFAANGALVAIGARERLRGSGPFEPRRVASVADVPPGGSLVFDFPEPGDRCLLLRLDSDRFVALGQKCTHLGCPVLYRHEEKKLHCPCHEGYFSAEDGRVLSGPPPRPLPRIQLERRGDDLWAIGIERT